jgi:peroxiredoxin (alkyl hydroperoxide reductase subunit C)
MSYVGKPAPEFHNLPSTRNLVRLDEPVSLDDYAGEWLVLVFYPADFGRLSPTELLAFSRAVPDLEELGAEVLAISTDGVHSHQAWIEFVLGKLNFPLASDTALRMCRDYGVLNEDRGVAERALFIIDPEGIVRYEVVHDLDTGRSVEEVMRVLQALVSPGRCAADWQPGDRHLLAGPAGL